MNDAGRWARARHWFDRLADLEPAAATAELDRLGADEPELAREVSELLAADRSAGDLDGKAGRWVVPDSGADPNLGRRVGAWRIESVIGVGGMGTVYRAIRVDDAFDKTAALKMVRSGLDGARFRERFARERRIVAALEHPGIARVLDGGETDDGIPYLVLEYVEGTELVAYCRERALGVEDRLRLFRRVLDAVSAAHRRLVVHRDLKPSNILVTAAGEPKLLDFGIAKLLEPEPEGAAQTVADERLLTLDYASPEQIRGEPVTTGTDVYSLGVVLFELLVGRTPGSRGKGAVSGLERALAEREAERPSEAAQRAGDAAPVPSPVLRGDLDAIVAKALRPRPEDRYASVEDLAADIDGFLAGRPVAARRGSRRYRVAKFVARNRLVVAAAALALLALSGTVALYTVRLRAERDRAERRFAETRELARALLFELHDAIRDIEGSTAARRLLLERGLRYLERLRAESAGDPTLTREVAEGYLRVAEILSDRRAAAGLELAQESAPLLETARSLVEPRMASSPTLEDRRLMVRVLGAIARRRFEGELDPASRLVAARRAVALADTVVHDQPESATDWRALARALRDEIDLLGFSGRIDRAGEAASRARQASAQAAALAPDDRDLRLDRAESELAFGRVMYRLGRGEEALAAFAVALELLENLAREAPESVEIRDRLATVLAASGSHTWQNGRAAEGVALLERAVALQSAAASADAENHQARRRLTGTRSELGVAMVAAGRFEEAFAAHGDALDALRRAAERPGAPAFLVYERAFLSSHLAAAARIAAGSAPDAAERARRLERARRWYAEALALHDQGSAAGVESHLEAGTWDRVRSAAAELGVR